MIRKRHFTLLEVLIATGLTVLVLTTLTFFYQQITLLNIKVDNLQQKAFKMLYVENRLTNTLTHSVSETKDDFFFFTDVDRVPGIKPETPSLIFTFDNGVKLDYRFSNHVLARLYLNENGQLTLVKWPSPRRWEEHELPPVHKEILIDNIKDLSFAFFIPPTPEREIQAEEQQKGRELDSPESRGRWIPEWKREFQHLPAIVNITLTSEDDKQVRFAFPLPHSPYHIIHEE